MPKKKYIVRLESGERKDLLALTKGGTLSARKLNRVHILLQADDGVEDKPIALSLHIGMSTVARTRQRFVEGGVEHALTEDHRLGGKHKLDAKQEAFLIATACSAPPDGRKTWTMQLLADRMVQINMVDAISDETVRRALKKTH
jgi:transposase